VELLDYRNYVPGDDLRRLDWNVLARLDALFIRVFRAEENLLVRTYVDCSRSMAFGQPSKGHLARRLAAALAYAALVGHDRVEVAACGGDALQVIPTASGEVGAARIWQFLSSLNFEGTGDFHRHALEAGSRLREPGLTMLFTDGLFDDGLLPTLRSFLAMGHELVAVQVLDREELAPTLEGDWRLADAEAPSRQVEVTLTAATTAEYRQRLHGYTEEVRDFCRRYGASYFLIPSDMEVEDVVLGLMRGSLAQ
jgi:uncharacterized protein (DUF58 family)